MIKNFYCIALVLVCVLFYSFGNAAKIKEFQWRQNHESPDKQLGDYVSRARELKSKVLESIQLDQFQDILNGVEVLDFEKGVCIAPPNGNTDYALIIDSLVVTPSHAYMVLYLVLDVGLDAGSGEHNDLVFVGRNIKFTKNGGFTGEAKLELAEDFTINPPDPSSGKNPAVVIRLLSGSTNGTYVEFDCDGFKKLLVNGRVTFDESKFIPEDSKGDLMYGDSVVGTFSTEVEDWENWMVNINFVTPKFQHIELPDFSFSLQNVILDHSDLTNPTNMKFPINYTSPFGTDSPLWRGVYMENIRVELPRAFKNRNRPAEEIAFYGESLIIDKTGLTGMVGAEGLLPLNEGAASEWKMSVDVVELLFTQNHVDTVRVGGQLQLPISSEEATLGYELHVSPPGSDSQNAAYFLTVNVEDTIDFAVFNAAEVRLRGGTYVDLDLTQNGKQFKPKAVLYGQMKLDPNLKGGDKKNNDRHDGEPLLSLEFEHLILKTEGEKISLGPNGSIVLGGEVMNTMANFPVQIEEAGIKSGEVPSKKGLYLELTVNLGGDKSAFGGSAGLTVWGEKSAVTQNWEYDRTELNSINISASTKTLEIEGELIFYRNDPTYGDGFDGQLEAKIKVKDKVIVSMQSNAVFGTASASSNAPEVYRYWFVDGAVQFSTAIPVFTGVGINGFSGGAYKHMSIVAPADSFKPEGDIGKTTSGIRYRPNYEVSLGIKAGIGIISTANEAMFSGDLNFEISFSNGGGINQVAFYGKAKMLEIPGSMNLEKLKEIAEKVDDIQGEANSGGNTEIPENKGDGAPIIVNWRTVYDVPNKTLSGNLGFAMNIVNAINAHGRIDIFFSPDDWYVYVGKPLDEHMVQVDLYGILELKSYFVTGSKLPNPKIAEIPADVRGKANTFIDQSMLGEGGGIAFGSRFDLDLSVKGRKMKACNAQPAAGVRIQSGFDVLLMRSEEEVKCKDLSAPRGFNNWYASGQAYAKIALYVGIDYSCALGKGTFKLAEAGAKVILAAQLPNPSWFTGHASVYVDILGGLVKGDAEFNVEFGDKCLMEDANDIVNIEIIDRLLPSDSVTGVNVYSKMVMKLRTANEKIFEMLNSNGETESVKIQIIPEEHLQLHCLDCADKSVVPGKYEWNKSMTQLTFIPNEVLESNKNYSLLGQAELHKKSGNNWIKMEGSDGSEYDFLEVHFSTAEEGYTMPVSNIEYSYPLPDMNNFYPEESKKGYIKRMVKPGKPLVEMPNYEFAVKYYSGQEAIYVSKDVQVHPDGEYLFEYPIPSILLEKGKRYTFKIVKTFVGHNQSQDEPATGQTTVGQAGGIGDKPDIVVVNFDFSVSNYRTFAEKFASFSEIGAEVQPGGIIKQSFNTLEFASNAAEAVSPEEVYGYKVENVETCDALIRPVRKSLPETFTMAVSAFYQLATVQEILLGEDREFALPPYNAIELNKSLNGAAITYTIPQAITKDISTVRNATDDPSSSVFNEFPAFRAGNYEYWLYYYLPGKSSPNSFVIASFELEEDIELDPNKVVL